MNNEAMNLSNRHSLTTMLIITSEQNTQQDAIADLFIFLIRYSFLFNEPASEEEILKRDFPYSGELSSQNPNGARYLDPKYSRWISVDPALGEYVPGAGKSNEADKLPGMGGLFNSINLSLFHYAGNNPVKYIDPDGREDSYSIKSFTMCGTLNVTDITKYSSNAGLNPEDILIMGGVLNMYRYREKTSGYNKFADNYSNVSTARNIAMICADYLGLETGGPLAAIGLLAIDKIVDIFKPEQFEKAADELGNFSSKLADLLEDGYKLSSDGIHKDTFNRTIIRSDGSKTLYDYEIKVNVFAHLSNPKTGDEVFISNVFKITGYKDE